MHKGRPDDATLLHETRDCGYRGVASVSNNVGLRICESWEHAASCCQDVVEEGFGSNAQRNKVASSGF